MKMNRCCFLLCLFLVPSMSLVVINKPFQSNKSPTETIYEYEIILPEVSFASGTSKEGHPKKVGVTVKLEGATFILNLQLNEILLSPKFASGYHSEGEIKEQGHENCFYHGAVKAHPEWKAVFSTCYGLRGWFGDISDKNKLYHIEPLEDTSSLTSQHVLYKDSEHKNDKNGVCGTHHEHEIGDLSAIKTDTHDMHRLKKRQAPQRLIVEWLLVNDFNQYVNYNQNLSAVVHRAIEIANQVDMLYQALNIRVVLVYSLTWTDSQQIQSTTDSETLLNRFQAYHRTNAEFRSIEHDSAMLITGIEINGATVGVAFLDRMCIYDESVGFTQDTGSSINSVGAIAAHELGHIFNMEHDSIPACNCPDQNGCIMNDQLGFPSPTQFSQCSTLQLSEGLGKGRGICLDNNPSMLVGDPMCGNGIKEPGEVCDCGSLQECQDPCCNATTCTLSAGSQCGEGPCCNDRCQFLEYGTMCRESRGECGITEYCTGDSAECPQDAYIQNGASCENSTSFCYDGLCTSRSAQCTQYYGENSRPSVDQCYTMFNTQGEPYGHCGAANDQFLKCATEDVGCGSIQCSGGRIIFSNIEYTGSIRAYTRSVFEDGGFEQCQAFSTPADSDEVSPGLVLEGTKCGNEKLCIGQKCVSVTTLGVTPCPVGDNGELCSGNGICNNLNRCSCVVGYNGSSCGEDLSRGRGGGNRSNGTNVMKGSREPITDSSTASMAATPTVISLATTSTQITPSIKRPTMSRVPTTTRTFITPVRQTGPDLKQIFATETNPKAFPYSINDDFIMSQSSLQREDHLRPTSVSSSVPTFYPILSPFHSPVGRTNPTSEDSDVFSSRFTLFWKGNTAAIAGGVVVAFIVLIAVCVAIGLIIALVAYKKATSTKPISPVRSRYSRKHSADGTRMGIHGSTDDLLVTTIATDGKSPSPVPPSSHGPYRPYVPPPYMPSSPSTTVSQNVRRPPPPPNPSSKPAENEYQTKLMPRPPPPPRPVPTSSKPAPHANRPAPPTNKPVPPIPSKTTSTSAKPTFVPRSNLGQTPPTPSPRPQMAPKPLKLGVQWPPTKEGSGSKPGPVPPKKPIIPSRK